MFVILILVASVLIGTIDNIIIPLRTTTHHNNNNTLLHNDNNSIATSTVYFHQYLPNNNNNNDSQQQTVPTASTAKELNLNSSESRNFYNSYDPWTLDDPNNRYQPIPMDIKIIDEIDGDVNRQEHDGNDDGDFDIPWNNDDTSEFDQDNSASFNVPKVQALKGCKTVNNI
ncbi:hypothetical protein BLA29_009678 [Euroglyphus maynei]|uniref:Uncharacterized protein n=1 Tax=Euroglyphus maynei TaxID=6958 RepID=A0A1Y3B857_EURMA|nr:hypothetical protein BLA29_009678 [Euroglyphus maynei]